MGYRAARRVQILLMGWLTLVFLATWLPLLRSAMDGPSYQWGGGHFGWQFHGAGLAGDYPFVLAKSALALALLWCGWRRPNGGFRPALVGWLALMLADTLYNVASAPDDYRFRGDTLGIDVSLALAAPLLDGAMLALAAWWATRAPALPVPPLARANAVLLATAALLLPLQYALLSRGAGQDASDVAGVLLTVLGWFLLNAGLGLWRIPSARPMPLAGAT